MATGWGVRSRSMRATHCQLHQGCGMSHDKAARRIDVRIAYVEVIDRRWSKATTQTLTTNRDHETQAIYDACCREQLSRITASHHIDFQQRAIFKYPVPAERTQRGSAADPRAYCMPVATSFNQNSRKTVWFASTMVGAARCRRGSFSRANSSATNAFSSAQACSHQKGAGAMTRGRRVSDGSCSAFRFGAKKNSPLDD